MSGNSTPKPAARDQEPDTKGSSVALNTPPYRRERGGVQRETERPRETRNKRRQRKGWRARLPEGQRGRKKWGGQRRQTTKPELEGKKAEAGRWKDEKTAKSTNTASKSAGLKAGRGGEGARRERKDARKDESKEAGMDVRSTERTKIECQA